MTRDALQRFLEKIEESASGCWLWTGAQSTSGYGHFRYQGVTARAHRVAYLLFKGAIHEISGCDVRGACVIHSCDNRLCVNPEHLRVGTHGENMLDKKVRGRVVTNPLLGEKHQNSKLTAEKVSRIREMEKNGIPRRKIADAMGVHKATISDVVRQRTWSHVTT